MKLSTNTSIFVIIITALLIIVTGAKINAQLCGKTLLDKDVLCGVSQIEQERLSVEKAKAKKREEADAILAEEKAKRKAEDDAVNKTNSDAQSCDLIWNPVKRTECIKKNERCF